MNRMSRLLAAMAMLAGAAAASAEINPAKMNPRAVEMRLGPRIEIPCHTRCEGYSGGGGVPCLAIVNPLQLTMPAGTRFHVLLLQDSNPVEHTLQSPLPPNGESRFDGPAALTCTAWLYAGLPDLQVVDAALVSGQLKLLVKNGAPFAAAPSSVARVRLAKCSQIELGTISVSVPQVRRRPRLPS